MAPAGNVGGLSRSTVFSQMFAALTANWVFLLLVFAPAYFAITLGSSFLTQQPISNQWLRILLPVLWQIPVIAAYAVLQGLFALKVVGGPTGGPLTTSEAAQLALPRALVFVFVSVLTYVGVTLGWLP